MSISVASRTIKENSLQLRRGMITGSKLRPSCLLRTYFRMDGKSDEDCVGEHCHLEIQLEIAKSERGGVSVPAGAATSRDR